MLRLTGLASIRCLVRSLPFFFGSTPRTPLRVLCIVALDTIHVRRYSQPLPRHRRKQLAAFLDFQACTNAVWDRKPVCAAEHESLRQELENAGLGLLIAEYLRRLHELETRRPSVVADLRSFDEVRVYREEVVRLSLATVTAIALNTECIEDAIRETHRDGDAAALFGMAMQCQIIDDVIDYRMDRSAGLPTFLTACSSLPHALALTARAARRYQVGCERSSTCELFPLRAALWVLTAIATLAVRLAPRLLKPIDGQGNDHVVEVR